MVSGGLLPSFVLDSAPFELEDGDSRPKSGSGPGAATPAARIDVGDRPFGDDGRAEAADHEQALRDLAPLAERAHAYAGRSKSDATIRAYAAGWRDFLSFCEQRELCALP